MNKLNNIVVENLSLEFGQELKKTFEDLEVNTEHLKFNLCKSDGNVTRFYGIIDNQFDNYYLEKVQQSNAKIITLEQLKAMINPYPKMMYVSDYEILDFSNAIKKEVYFEKEIEGVNYYFTKTVKGFTSWKKAVDLDYFDNQVKEITIEEIAQRFGYPIEQIRIKK